MRIKKRRGSSKTRQRAIWWLRNHMGFDDCYRWKDKDLFAKVRMFSGLPPFPEGTPRKVIKRWVDDELSSKMVPQVHATRNQTIKEEFFSSEDWLKTRYRVLKANDGCCECCGARASKGKPLHVDHIKPRSKYPHLALEITNLQVLCGDCNMGKGAWDETDWRDRDLKVVVSQ